MKEIIFLKNEKEENINVEKIEFDQDKITIIKKEKDYNIILDFLNKSCVINLISDNLSFPIEVVYMNYQKYSNNWIFKYQLLSEIDVENIIKITV